MNQVDNLDNSLLVPVIQDTPLPREYGIDLPTFPAIIEFEKRLGNINKLLVELDEYLTTRIFPPESQDIFRVVSLYKVGFGYNFILDRLGRMYVLVNALQVTNIIITSPIAPPTSATIPPGKWVSLNLPDASSITLDTIAPANELKIYVRYTMVPNNNDGPTVP